MFARMIITTFNKTNYEQLVVVGLVWGNPEETKEICRIITLPEYKSLLFFNSYDQQFKQYQQGEQLYLTSNRGIPERSRHLPIETQILACDMHKHASRLNRFM